MPREFECVVLVVCIHKHIVGENKENLPVINSMSGGGLEEAHLHLTTFRLVLKIAMEAFTIYLYSYHDCSPST